MEVNKDILVSVIIPTYKRSDKLPRAIKSVLQQTYRNVEVLVVSDNEPDDEFTNQAKYIVESFNDERVRLIVQEHHKNGAAARNAGIIASTGDLIAFLDDDDFWDKEKLAIQVPVLMSLDDSWGGVSCLNKIFKGGVLSHLQQKYESGYLFKKILLRRLEVSTDTVVLRKKCLLSAGVFDENLKRHQEVQLFTFFTQKYKMLLIDKYLCNVDIDDNSNRPTPERFSEIKQQFLKSVKPVMDTMTKYEQYSIRIANHFELGGLYFLHHHYFEGVKICLSVLTSPLAFYSACVRMKHRLSSRRVPNEYQGKTISYYEEINGLL